MKKINKKAFTIIELVIVIAVIAILAAVLIPTFTKLVRKSKVNNDTELIRNLNTALEAEKVENGNHATMTEVLATAEAYGYIVGNINATATKNEILWDSRNDVFCYYNFETDAIEYLPDSVAEIDKLDKNSFELWKIYNTAVPDFTAQTNSIYLGNKVAADSVANVDHFIVGVDAGTQTVGEIKYQRAGSESDKHTVTIRTNGGALIVNAPYDSVKHYGEASLVDIQAVYPASYHENGDVAMLKITQGKFVAEDNSRVSTLYIEANDVKVNIEDKAEVTLVAKAEGVEPLSVVVAGVEKKQEVEEKTVAQIEIFEAAAARYAGGDGSKEYPFLISKYEHINESLREDVSNGATRTKYYKLIADIDLGANFVPLGTVDFEYTSPTSAHVVWSNSKPFEGQFDGDYHTIVLKQNNDGCACLFNAIKYGYPVGGYIIPYYFKNVNFDVDLKAAQNASVIANTAASYGYKSTKFYVQNITVNGSIVGDTGAASLFCSVGSQTNSLLKFENVTNNANITVHKFISGGTGNYVMCAGIVGTVLATSTDGEADFINCRNNGDLICDLVEPSINLINTNTSKYFTTMGHMVGQTYNTSLTDGKVSVIKFIGCSFRADAKIEGYSAKDGKLANFEGIDKSNNNKTTYVGTPNFNKQLMGGSISSNVFVGEDADHLVEYARTGSNNYFTHGGVEGTNGRIGNSTANYPAE